VETPIERIIETPIYIEKIREIPVERITETRVDKIINNPVFID
jgi:hypothetical protein